MSSILAAGQQLGRYRILRLLGSGAMGDVYLAEDPQIERQLALKTVRVAEAKQEELEDRKRRLLREAKAAGKLIHPHVVTLFDAGEADGVLYLAFEFVGGSDLGQRLDAAAAGAPLTLAEVLRIVREAAEALDFAHRHGIVHRDIKPSNILLDTHGRVKVADFGIAKVVGQSTELTMTGSVVGSPHYLSPEQVRGEELDGRSDIFSLGIVLYELLGHQRPFQGESLTTLVYQILHQEPPPIPSLRPDLAPRLEQLVRRMIAKQRDQRFATAGELAQEVAAVERELGAAVLALPATVDAAQLERTMRLGGQGAPAPSSSGLHAAPTVVHAAAPTVVQPAAPTAPVAVPGAVGPGVGVTPVAAPPVATPPAARRRSPLPWILAGLAVFLVGAVAAGWFFLGRPLLRSLKGSGAEAPPVTAEAEPGGPGNAAPAADLAPPPAPAAKGPALEPPTPPVAEPGAVPRSETAETAQRAEAEPAVPAAPPAAPPRRESAAARTTTPAAPDPPREPEPVRRAAEPRPPPPPAAIPPPRPEPPPPAPEPEPVAEAAEPSVPAVAFDREMHTGLELAFQVQPPAAVINVRPVGARRGTVIGRAGEYSGRGRRPQTYSLPEPGDYVITLHAGGGAHRILVHAAAGGSPAIISWTFPGARRK